jgi:site-specific recombinase XerD
LLFKGDRWSVQAYCQPGYDSAKKDVITKDEIVQLLRVASLRERAIIETMASSGLRVMAALNPRELRGM